MKTILLLFAAALTFISACSQTSKPTAGTGNRAQQLTDSIYKASGVPGILVATSEKGKRTYYASGFANLETKQLFDSATLFEAGSITKTFTAYVLLSVLKEKGITETTPIVNYLPDSVKANKALQTITFLQLLNHTAGFARMPDNIDATVSNQMQPYEHYSIHHLFSYLKTCQPKFTGKSSYSNLGFGLAGVLAARINGKTYAQLLDDNIFMPFKMAAPGKGVVQNNNNSKGYFENEATNYWTMNSMEAAGGLKCNAVEMLSYLESMITPVNKDAKVIIDSLLSSTVTLQGSLSVGRAWHIITKPGKPVIYWHNGGTYGFSTFVAFEKNSGKAVMVAINQFNKNAYSDGLGFLLIKLLLQ
jgi:CubicO group peptidase (beta-lactamase class C family)